MTHLQLCRRVDRVEQMYAVHKCEEYSLEAESERLKPCQREVFESPYRFRVLVAGRRFGKTFLALTELLRAAAKPGSLSWYVAPTRMQAKRVARRALKKLTQPYWSSIPNETDMRIEIRGGGAICVRGADNYDALRGDGLDFVVLDEYADMADEVWPEVLRPALSDKKGRALFIGTPRGCNHFFDLYQNAQGRPLWTAFQFTTADGGNVAPSELESATRDLDEKTYRQEFEANFENQSGGLIYYAFDRKENMRRGQFNPMLPLFWALDFNVDPLCSVIGQRDGDNVSVLEEIVLTDSNTAALGEAFLKKISRWGLPLASGPQIIVYGDSSGNARHTSAARTDWEIIKEFFRSKGYRADLRVRSSNPLVKDRVNCVNAILCNQAGERRMRIDPACKQLIMDFERVRWKTDSNGNLLQEIDKSDPARSHLSDALGYFIAREFGMRPKSGEQYGIMQ
jgi:hypothetical protein